MKIGLLVLEKLTEKENLIHKWLALTIVQGHEIPYSYFQSLDESVPKYMAEAQQIKNKNI